VERVPHLYFLTMASGKRALDVNGNSDKSQKSARVDSGLRMPARPCVHQDEHAGLDAAMAKAMSLFSEHFVAFSLNRDAGNADEVTREDRACELGEKMADERYEDSKAALLDLLPWVGPLKPATPTAQGRSYDVIEFEGKQPPRHIEELKKGGKPLSCDKIQKAQLEWLRTFGDRTRGWEALTAVMCCMAARSEMSWMESFCISSEIQYKVKKVPGCASKGSVKRKAWIRQYLLDQMQYGCGNWVSYLIHHNCTVRVAFAQAQAPGVPRHIPVSVLIHARQTLWDALQHQDDNGPIKFGKDMQKQDKQTDKRKRDWLMTPGREFAFQLANFEEDEENKLLNRVSVKTLQPDSKLRTLLRSKQLVSQLEVIAALAPRDLMKKEGLSEIVKAELANFMRDAKARGEAVVFCLGSTSPHMLAQKVYLRPPIGDYGLQCGYLRWRDSPDVPWASEKNWHDRICLCLQMP